MHVTNVLPRIPVRLRKRDDTFVSFDSGKISAAIQKAGRATNEYDDDEACLLTAQVIKVLSHLSSEDIHVERIQDIVEQTLIAANHITTARAYIVYREQHKRLRQYKQTLVDVASSVNEYLDRADWRVSANANQGYSLGGLILNTSGKMTANYWLNHVYPPEILYRKHKSPPGQCAQPISAPSPRVKHLIFSES